MVNKFKVYVPWGNSFKTRDAFFKFDHFYKHKHYYFQQSKNPFFSLLNEDCTPRCFIEAVKKNNNEDAQSYLSKNLGYNVDLETIRGIFKSDYNYKYLVEASFNNSRSHKIKSVMLTDRNCRFKGIVHFYLIKEPDGFSNWKIFKIVKE